MNLIRITDDLFDISARLRSINENYEVYYNPTTAKYEVRDAARNPSVLAFVVPYDSLDCRTLEYAAYTSVRNAEKLLADIERENSLLEKEASKKALDEFVKLTEANK